MKTLLVIATQPALATALRAALETEGYRVLSRADVREAEPLLRQGLVDVCVLDADLTDVQPIRLLELLRRVAPECPVIIYSNAAQWEWEEEAYLLGVKYVLNKPIRARMLISLLERLLAPAAPKAEPVPLSTTVPARLPEKGNNSRPTLEVLRGVSGILRHGLCLEALLREFLLLLREIIGVNRAAIFLREPPGSLALASQTTEDRRFHAACALGLAPGLMEHLELSLDAGIGGYIYRTGRILTSNDELNQHDREIRKEFELLGAQVAIPILDRESVVGLAVFDGRLTGEALAHEELALIFHLLEQLGMAIKNTWLHTQLSANHSMMTDILSQFGSGCVVVGSNLNVLHSNRMARTLFSRRAGAAYELEFWEIPQVLGSKVFEVIKTGQPASPIKYCPQPGKETVYQVKITPFFQRNANTANAALLIIEDYTQLEHSQQLEIESANLRLVKSMAAHLAHEIGNSLVPLSTHQQMIGAHFRDPEFRTSLSEVMAEGVKRISRMAKQMLYLAGDAMDRSEKIMLSELLAGAFAEAQACFTNGKAEMTVENDIASITLTGDGDALKHALAELFLNSFQANPVKPQVRLRSRLLTHEANGQKLHLELNLAIQDGGTGFTPEVAQRAREPFFSTRNVGLGLGLTVARKIIEAHHGRLEIVGNCDGSPSERCASCNNDKGVVCLFLPLHANRHFAPEPTETPAAPVGQPVSAKTPQAPAFSNR